MRKLKTFDNFKAEKLGNINESAFKFQDHYTVKTSFDLPAELVQSYIAKVQEQTGKNPLDNWSESEIAEQLVNFIVKYKVSIDDIPAELVVGEESQDFQNSGDAAETEEEFGKQSGFGHNFAEHTEPMYTEFGYKEESENGTEEEKETEEEETDFDNDDEGMSRMSDEDLTQEEDFEDFEDSEEEEETEDDDSEDDDSEEEETEEEETEETEDTEDEDSEEEEEEEDSDDDDSEEDEDEDSDDDDSEEDEDEDDKK